MANNFFQKIINFFREATIKEIPLRFEMDQLPNGNHLVKILMGIDEKWKIVEKPGELQNYGYRIEKEGKIFVLDPEDQQIIHALFSLNPKIHPDGSLEFEISPSVLNYLRKKEVKEGEKSKKIRIFENSLEPKAQIDFDPQTGIKVETGFKVGKEEIIPLHKFEQTRDEEYLRLGNDFYLKPELSQTTKKWLREEIIVIPPEKIPEFFKRDLVLLKTKFNAVLTENFKKIKIVEEPWKVFTEVNYYQKRNWLEFNIIYKVGEYVLPHHLLKVKEKYLRYNPYIWIKIDSNTVNNVEKNLSQLEPEKTKEGYKLPIYQFQNLKEFIEKIGGEKEFSIEFQKFLENLSGFKEDENFDVGKEITDELKKENIELRPYQKGGIHWMGWLRKNRLHGILADDMGLGKTIQVVVALSLAYKEEKVNLPSLVVCPKPVMENWKKEADRIKMPNIIYHGQNRTLPYIKRPYLIISTYTTILNDIEFFQKIPLFFLIVDEATNIKNPWTQRSKALKSLNALHRLAITGTPIENRLLELWSIFDFVMPGFFRKYEDFKRNYEIPILQKNEKKKEELIRKIRPFVRRKLKKDVEKFLPEKEIIKEWCELTEEQKALYGQIIERYKSVREALIRGEKVNYTKSILPVLIKLKQVCDHPYLITKEKEPKIEGRSEKFDRFLEKIKEIIESGQKAVLFSQYLDSLTLFEKALSERRINYLRLDGSTLYPENIIKEFNEGKPQIILCSLRASSHGINLPAASHVFHFDRWWNPAIEDQATDRAHRLGQRNKSLFIHHILTRGTLEEKIDKLLEEKRQLQEEIIGAPILQHREFTREELIEILKPFE